MKSIRNNGVMDDFKAFGPSSQEDRIIIARKGITGWLVGGEALEIGLATG
jgi:hypothetical protein